MDKAVSLTHFTQARAALQKANRIDEVIKIRDAAERMRMALKQAKEAPEMVNNAVEIKVRAERRAGEMLREGAKKGDRVKRGKNSTPRNSKSQKLHRATSETPTLAEIGISKTQSSRWQTLADIPEAKFEQKIQEIKEKPGAELSTRGRSPAKELVAGLKNSFCVKVVPLAQHLFRLAFDQTD